MTGEISAMSDFNQFKSLEADFSNTDRGNVFKEKYLCCKFLNTWLYICSRTPKINIKKEIGIIPCASFCPGAPWSEQLIVGTLAKTAVEEAEQLVQY